MSIKTRISGSPRNGRFVRANIIVLLAVVTMQGCATTRVNDLGEFDVIAMNRVVPFPNAEELAERAFDVVIVPGRSGDVDAASLEEPFTWVRGELMQMSEEAGAVVRPASSTGYAAAKGAQATDKDVDYVLAVSFETYAEDSNWKPPYQFLWESTDEVAFQPGTCTNRADVDYRIDVIEADHDAKVLESFRLRHSAEQTSKNVDQTCPMESEIESALFEKAMMESLGCLRRPIDRLLAPRGHVTAHRFSAEQGQDLYQISLGSHQGIEVGEDVEVRREQHSAKPSGEASRVERVIAQGVVTDRLEEESAWVAIDRARAEEEILAGDVVRPTLREGLLSSLSGPNCKRILESR